MIGHIHINFLYGRKTINCLIKDKLDVLVVMETWWIIPFHIEGFTNPFRLDRDRCGGGVMIFINCHLPVREISFETKPNDVEVIFLQLTLRSKMWLVVGGYYPKKEFAHYLFCHVSRQLDRIMASYDIDSRWLLFYLFFIYCKLIAVKK